MNKLLIVLILCLTTGIGMVSAYAIDTATSSPTSPSPVLKNSQRAPNTGTIMLSLIVVYGARIHLRASQPIPPPIVIDGQRLSVPLALEALKASLTNAWPTPNNRHIHCQFITQADSHLYQLECSKRTHAVTGSLGSHWVNPGGVKALLAKLPSPGHPFTLLVEDKGVIVAVYHYGDPDGWQRFQSFSRDHTLMVKSLRGDDSAFAHLRHRAGSGVATAGEQLGVYYWRQGHPKQAIYWLRYAVSENSYRAETLLGYFYTKGIGTKKDFSNAALLSWRAAQAAYPAGLFNLGGLYAHGLGVPRNTRRGYTYQKAAFMMGLQVKPSVKHSFDQLAAGLKPHVRRAADLAARRIATYPQNIEKP